MKLNIYTIYLRLLIITSSIYFPLDTHAQVNNCDNPTGVSSSAFLGSVADPGNSIDGDLSTESTLSTLISILGIGSATLNVNFQAEGTSGDSLIVIYQSSSALLSLVDYLSFTFTNATGGTYSTSTANMITLLYIGGQQYARLAVPTAAFPYKSVKITLSAAAAIAPTASIYEVYRVPNTVIATALNNGVSCTGQETLLNATTTPSSTYSYQWSSTSDFVSVMASTPNLQLGNLSSGNHTYYVRVTDNACPNRTGSTSVTFTTYSTPKITPESGTIFNGATRGQSYIGTDHITITDGSFSSLSQVPSDAGFFFNPTTGYINASNVNATSTASISSVPVSIIANNSGCTSTSVFTVPLSWVLPIVYSKDLTASILNSNVVLEWATATEINNKYFDV